MAAAEGPFEPQKIDQGVGNLASRRAETALQ
jgi:hypothetical protein